MMNVNADRAKWIRFRMGIVCGLMGLGCGLIVSSAYKIQIKDGEDWRSIAETQRQRRLHVAPKRGTVYDRNGVALAVSVEVPSISADAYEMFRGVTEERFPQVLKDYSERIAKALSLDPKWVAKRIARKRRFVWLKRQASAQEVKIVQKLRSPRETAQPIRGLQVEGEGRRYYPNRSLAAPLLGFVAPDGEGKDGLEFKLEDELRGHVEEVKGLRDRSGRLIFAEGVPNEKALAGHSIYLSLDQGIQYVAEQELDTAVRTYEANSGSVVVVDPHTGQILALASSPTFNPNDYRHSEPTDRRNRAVQDRFEPGSTMKVFAIAGALAAGTLKPTQQVFCERGSMAIDNVVIHDTHINGWMTPTAILSQSSNICAAKIGLELGEQRLYEAYRRFGFGEPTGVPLPGEASGVLRPRNSPWVQVETAAASFGQGVSTSTLQLAMALSAIANGGKLMKPILVKKVVDGLGNVVHEYPPEVRRRAVPTKVARMLSEMLVAVTEGEGTGIEAAFEGFKVAGKTATAQKADPTTGRYTQDRFTSSFMGFVPADNPRIAIVVVLDEPMITHAGGSVAAPTFRRVAEFSLRYLGVTPKGTKKATFADMNNDKEDKNHKEPGPGSKPAGSSSAMVAAAPKAPLFPNLPVPVVRKGEPTVVVPSLVGLPAREAMKVAISLGLSPSLVGWGVVKHQHPSASTLVNKGEALKLFFEPPS
jgi:cell division protein FtsI (penicillin-binding protein 3)